MRFTISNYLSIQIDMDQLATPMHISIYTYTKQKLLLRVWFYQNIDANIKGKIAPEWWQVFIDITERCVKNKPDERPKMGEVEVQLEHALLLQEQADITNTNAHYTLLSKTIIPLGMIQ